MITLASCTVTDLLNTTTQRQAPLRPRSTVLFGFVTGVALAAIAYGVAGHEQRATARIAAVERRQNEMMAALEKVTALALQRNNPSPVETIQGDVSVSTLGAARR